MSYATVLAENAGPTDQMPKPDPGFLEGQENPSLTEINQTGFSDRNSKENALGDQKNAHSNASNEGDGDSANKSKERVTERSKKAAKKVRNEVDEPKPRLGFLTFINGITLTATAFAAFKYWNKPSWDRRFISACVIGIGGLIASQGYLAQVFRSSKTG